MSGNATQRNELIERVRTLLAPYDNMRLECDGFTQVAHYALTQACIPHDVYVGQVAFNEKWLPLHFWIMLDARTVVDYRLRMWFGADAPHGVFEYSGDCPLIYEGKPQDMVVTKMIFEVLTSSWGETCDQPK